MSFPPLVFQLIPVCSRWLHVLRDVKSSQASRPRLICEPSYTSVVVDRRFSSQDKLSLNLHLSDVMDYSSLEPDLHQLNECFPLSIHTSLPTVQRSEYPVHALSGGCFFLRLCSYTWIMDRSCCKWFMVVGWECWYEAAWSA